MKYRSFLVVCLWFAGCTDDSFARFEVDGITAQQECLTAMFPFEPAFMTARDRQESVGLLMQSSSSLNASDIVYLEVFDVAAAEAGEVLMFSPPGTLSAQATGEIEFGASCPDLIESLYLTGGVQFSSLDTNADGLVIGELVGVSVASSRSAGLVAESMTGSWQIKVQSGQPYEEFYED